MGDRAPITERGAEGRVTAYGDRAVAQGDTAARPPAAAISVPSTLPVGTGSSPTSPAIATVMIYDPQSRLKGRTATAILTNLERDLNAIRYPGKPPDFLLTQFGLRFEARHLSRMSTADERYNTARLDFPLYILNADTNDATSAKQIRELMLDHGIRDAGVAREQFEAAESGWTDRNVEGLGIQPLDGFKKVAFVKGDNVTKVAKDVEAGFTNVIKHELGHMFNIKMHSSSGVMRSGVQLAAGLLDYTDSNRATILTTLATLKMLSEAELLRRYLRQNP